MHILGTPRYAGTERHVQCLMVSTRAQRALPVLACQAQNPMYALLKDANFELYPIFTGRPPLLDLPVLIAAIRDARPDVLHVHDGNSMLLASLASQVVKTPIVATQHFLAPQHTTYRGAKRAAVGAAHRWVRGRISHFIAISEAVKREMLARQEAADGRITVVHNGIPDASASELVSTQLIREEFGAIGTTPFIVSVARLEPEKNLDMLVTAMQSVQGVMPGVICVIAGEGSLQAELSARIEELGLSQTVRLAGFRPDALSLVRASDIFVLPSLAEPFGLSVLEAMAFSKPVIATRAGGPEEIVADCETGILVSPMSFEELAAAILQLFNDKSLARSMGHAGKARFEALFTADRMATATVKIYHKVAARPDYPAL